MERRHILVEVHHEEIQAPRSGGMSALIVSNHIVVMARGFGGQRPHLSVAAGVTGEEKNGDAIQLGRSQPRSIAYHKSRSPYPDVIRSVRIHAFLPVHE